MASPGRPPLHLSALEPTLTATIELPAAMGSRQVSSGGVAAEPAVSVGRLQPRFGSRDTLIHKACEHPLLHVTDRILQLLEDPGPVTTRLRAAVDEVNPSESVRQHCNVIAKEPNRV